MPIKQSAHKETNLGSSKNFFSFFLSRGKKQKGCCEIYCMGRIRKKRKQTIGNIGGIGKDQIKIRCQFLKQLLIFHVSLTKVLKKDFFTKNFSRKGSKWSKRTKNSKFVQFWTGNFREKKRKQIYFSLCSILYCLKTAFLFLNEKVFNMSNAIKSLSF